jgi:hypothetical protein
VPRSTTGRRDDPTRRYVFIGIVTNGCEQVKHIGPQAVRGRCAQGRPLPGSTGDKLRKNRGFRLGLAHRPVAGRRKSGRIIAHIQRIKAHIRRINSAFERIKAHIQRMKAHTSVRFRPFLSHASHHGPSPGLSRRAEKPNCRERRPDNPAHAPRIRATPSRGGFPTPGTSRPYDTDSKQMFRLCQVLF